MCTNCNGGDVGPCNEQRNGCLIIVCQKLMKSVCLLWFTWGKWFYWSVLINASWHVLQFILRCSLECPYSGFFQAWWRHQMETFSALLAICAGNSPVPGEFRAQRPVTRGFDVFFDLRLDKRLSKQSWGWWFETLSLPLRRHSNGLIVQRCIRCMIDWRRNIKRPSGNSSHAC